MKWSQGRHFIENPREGLKILTDGGKLGQVGWHRHCYLHWPENMPFIVDHDGKPFVGDIMGLDKWYVWDGPKGIDLKPEDVGRVVKLRNGQLRLLTVYDPKQNAWYACEDKFDSLGVAYLSKDGEHDIVEFFEPVETDEDE